MRRIPPRGTPVTDVPLPDPAPSTHQHYAPGQRSTCPLHHGLCAYTGTEPDRCPLCHSTYAAHTPVELTACAGRLTADALVLQRHLCQLWPQRLRGWLTRRILPSPGLLAGGSSWP